MKSVIVTGYMIRYPVGGQLAAHFQYVLGLARMGYDVHFVEEAGWGSACFDPEQVISSDDPASGYRLVEALFARHGLGGRWTFVDIEGNSHGLPRKEVARIAKKSFLVSLSDVSWLPELEKCPLRLYIDEDPGFPQMGLAGGDEGWRAKLERYHFHASYGESIGRADCLIPTCGYDWIPTRQPIVLDLWENAQPPGERWTTLMNWTSYNNVVYEGVEYGQKDREMRKVFDLPEHTDEPLEVAVSSPAEVQDELKDAGWGVREAVEASRTFGGYRDYIRGSRGEFSVAKHAYVATRSGWFSDRSAAYLASGRPVVLQDTGFGKHLPLGEGLLAWTSREEAAEALRRVSADIMKHSQAARRLAEEHCGHEQILGRLLERAGAR
jgi:hypothetical protein